MVHTTLARNLLVPNITTGSTRSAVTGLLCHTLYSVLPDGTYRKSRESAEFSFFKILRFFFGQYGYHFAGKDKPSVMTFIMSSVEVCVETKLATAVAGFQNLLAAAVLTTCCQVFRAHRSISPSSGARGLQRSVYLKSYNVQKRIIRFTLRLNTVKNTHYMKKSFE